jgi:hypothetical protein
MDVAMAAAAVSAIFFSLQFRTKSKRPGDVRLSSVSSKLLMFHSTAMLHNFTHFDSLQPVGNIWMLLSTALIMCWSEFLLSANYYVAAHPSLVHWSQWKKEKWIGSGSFGQVYLASYRERGLFCAIKEIQIPDPDSKEQIKKLYWVFVIHFSWLSSRRLMNITIFVSLV